jgi:2,3-bisphosphoglycerate-independent phosphoglycerate mutase
MPQNPRPIVLMILDGFGYRESTQYNAIAQAKTPCWDRLWQHYPRCLISASGHCVGLPKGQMGNSEVGHLNLGAGREVAQSLSRITMAIEDGSFAENAVLTHAVDQALSQGKNIHVMGLLSPGGVHSHEQHVFAMVAMAKARGAKQVYVHAFLDGRDTPPQSALASIQALEAIDGVQLVSMVGRYYAMDRDQRWERVEQAYRLLCAGDAEFSATSGEAALKLAYARGEGDEFVKPTCILQGEDPVCIRPGDSVIFMNFRADRARELSQALIDPDFDGFQRGPRLEPLCFVSLTEYHQDFDCAVAYPPESLEQILGEVVADQGLHQLRMAETEKYAHVTFFFNGGREVPFKNEERVLIPSPKVATYDLQPAMSAVEMTDRLLEAIAGANYDLIVINYANPDMVGHTGNLAAAVEAIEVVDACLTRVVEALQAVGGELLLTADHGNAECMYNPETQQPHTAHTSELVPCLYMGRSASVLKAEGGRLADIAPTVLQLLGLEVPSLMTGSALFTLQDS